jgi:hypothetical protein
MGGMIKWGIVALAGIIALGSVVNAKKAKQAQAEAATS